MLTHVFHSGISIPEYCIIENFFLKFLNDIRLNCNLQSDKYSAVFIVYENAVWGFMDYLDYTCYTYSTCTNSLVIAC